MKKEIDLEEVKRIASLFLWLPPHETEFAPVIVKHPFTDCGMVVLRSATGVKSPNVSTHGILKRTANESKKEFYENQLYEKWI